MELEEQNWKNLYTQNSLLLQKAYQQLQQQGIDVNKWRTYSGELRQIINKHQMTYSENSHYEKEIKEKVQEKVITELKSKLEIKNTQLQKAKLELLETRDNLTLQQAYEMKYNQILAELTKTHSKLLLEMEIRQSNDNENMKLCDQYQNQIRQLEQQIRTYVDRDTDISLQLKLVQQTNKTLKIEVGQQSKQQDILLENIEYLKNQGEITAGVIENMNKEILQKDIIIGDLETEIKKMQENIKEIDLIQKNILNSKDEIKIESVTKQDIQVELKLEEPETQKQPPIQTQQDKNPLLQDKLEQLLTDDENDPQVIQQEENTIIDIKLSNENYEIQQEIEQPENLENKQQQQDLQIKEVIEDIQEVEQEENDIPSPQFNNTEDQKQQSEQDKQILDTKKIQSLFGKKLNVAKLIGNNKDNEIKDNDPELSSNDEKIQNPTKEKKMFLSKKKQVNDSDNTVEIIQKDNNNIFEDQKQEQEPDKIITNKEDDNSKQPTISESQLRKLTKSMKKLEHKQEIGIEHQQKDNQVVSEQKQSKSLLGNKKQQDQLQQEPVDPDDPQNFEEIPAEVLIKQEDKVQPLTLETMEVKTKRPKTIAPIRKKEPEGPKLLPSIVISKQ
ncbi:hypothetical protein SS50377_24663 [Spironucleus salmonicida]|uniref:Uncharacterized protein n=1 Tax=Spironucleus salmonicida TaxID=348837 RepID=V6LUI6_9EUKA|nr:hypothetical protein SS50377_24663 [Spironucleus salmonicida]|eukprot:EST44474.1 Hypothetical protein SS50377_15468 [Spironucleus salmonicida]